MLNWSDIFSAPGVSGGGYTVTLTKITETTLDWAPDLDTEMLFVLGCGAAGGGASGAAGWHTGNATSERIYGSSGAGSPKIVGVPFLRAMLPTTIDIEIGEGGLGGAPAVKNTTGSTAIPGNDGVTGGDTHFGDFLTIEGGNPGQASSLVGDRYNVTNKSAIIYGLFHDTVRSDFSLSEHSDGTRDGNAFLSPMPGRAGEVTSSFVRVEAGYAGGKIVNLGGDTLLAGHAAPAVVDTPTLLGAHGADGVGANHLAGWYFGQCGQTGGAAWSNLTGAVLVGGDGGDGADGGPGAPGGHAIKDFSGGVGSATSGRGGKGGDGVLYIFQFKRQS